MTMVIMMSIWYFCSRSYIWKPVEGLLFIDFVRSLWFGFVWYSWWWQLSLQTLKLMTLFGLFDNNLEFGYMNDFASIILSSVTFGLWLIVMIENIWHRFSSVKDLSLIWEKLSWWWKFCGWYWTSLTLEGVVLILNVFNLFNELVVKWLMIILEWVSSILISFKMNWYKKSKLRGCSLICFLRWRMIVMLCIWRLKQLWDEFSVRANVFQNPIWLIWMLLCLFDGDSGFCLLCIMWQCYSYWSDKVLELLLVN